MKLTQTVKKGGCAAKVSALELRKILSKVKIQKPSSNVLVNGSNFDDAGVYRISDEISLVQTLDFFTPILDSPKDFGSVAAANALSDVYAMGGKPISAMAILAYSVSEMEPEIIAEVLQAGFDKCAEAGADLLGGHSIDDDTLKFGFSVTGTVPTENIWKNTGAKLGDLLILTKPIGVGTICAGLKRGIYSESEIQEVILSMAKLNNAIDHLEKSQLKEIACATDITGFGLVGHLSHIAKGSQIAVEVDCRKLPLFELTKSSLGKGHLTKAHTSNYNYTKDMVNFDGISELNRSIVCDPQTSGGLLISVSERIAQEILPRIESHFKGTSIIGRVTASRKSGENFSPTIQFIE